MENTPINLEYILEQAPNWTFAGDCTLLQWMIKISQSLETRANKSSEALSKLNNNVRSINIGLDNVANSLTTLQFGNQFVECRVQDDDETLANINETISGGNNEIEKIPTSQEMLKTFLDNNLKILRNCHEKYSLDLDDSDDDEEEEGSKEKTCIYQPINPYNERPLPFIFGSKDWHAKWHVGLNENKQDNYSGDEISETFSDSSSTNSPADDQESFESNTEWVSSNSIDNDKYNANIQVRNASSLRGSQALYPGTPSIPIKVNKAHPAISESSSISTPSSSLAKSSIQTKKHSEIKRSRSESISSINSKASAKNVSTTQVITNEKSLPYKTTAPPFVDLFAEPPEDIVSTTSSSISSNQNMKRPSVDYSTTLPKQTQPAVKEKSSGFKTQSSAYFDLFAEPPEDIPSTTSSSLSSTQKNIKRKPVNLFDDDDDDNDKIEDYLLPAQTKKQDTDITKSSTESFIKDKVLYKDDLLPIHTKKDDFIISKSTGEEASTKTQHLTTTLVKDKPLNVPKTSNSLFDDDDDDENDDFLKAFVKKSAKKESSKTSLSKTLLFDNDLVTEQKDFLKNSKTKETKTNKVNIFDDLEDDDDNLVFNTGNKISVEQKSHAVKNFNVSDTKENAIEKDVKVDKTSTNNNKKSVNLFDYLEEDYVKEDIKQNTETKKVGGDSFTVKAKKKINLFDDLEDDDDDADFFAIKSKEILNKISDSHQIKSISKPTYISKDKHLKKSSESLIKSKEDVEFQKSLNKEYVSQKVSTDSIETKENKNIKEVSNEINEQIFTQGVSKSMDKSIEPSNETKPILTQKVQINSEVATKEQEIEDTSYALIKNNQNSILNEDNARMSKKENLNDLTFKPSICNQKLNKMSADWDKKSENSTTKTLLQNDDSHSNTTDEKTVVSDTDTSKEIESSSCTTKYDFNSVLFLDEPPEDDSEFFETLSKSPLTLNTKYNTIDLENDLYEPELPKVPMTNANTIATDATDNNKTTSLYTGLQLFSDIPPDDDADVDEDDIQSSSKKFTQTKRLHSVFYDDVNETLMALNLNQQEIQSSHSVFQNEPPPLKEKETSSTLNINRDVVDHKLLQVNSNDNENLRKSDHISLESSEKRPVSKLQMPNININVQALLPGANTTLRKAKEDSKKISEKKPDIDVVVTEKKQLITATKIETTTVPQTAETEHILHSITKTRVRAPATRRPSSRKARQDNYRKSLFGEENDQVFESINITQNPSSNKNVKVQVKAYPLNIEELKENSTLDLERKQPVNTRSLIFDDNDDDNSDILKNINFSKTKYTTESKREDSPNDDTITPISSKSLQKVDKKSSSSLLFDSEEDEDENNFFKHIKSSKTKDLTEDTQNKSQTRKELKPTEDNSFKASTREREKEENSLKPTEVVTQTSIPTISEVTSSFGPNLKLTEKNQKHVPKLESNKEASKFLKGTVSFLNDDHSDDDNLCGTSNIVNKQEEIQSSENSSLTKPEISKEIPTKSFKNSKPLTFLDNENDNNLFEKPSTSENKISSLQKNPPNPIKTKESNQKAKAQFKSFLDSESDEEDFTVAGLQTRKSTQPKTPTTLSAIADTSKTSTEITSLNKNAAIKLFTDSDTDSEDLFANITASKSLNKPLSQEDSKILKNSKPQSSLFSDDSDSDDFLKTSESFSKNVDSSIREKKAKVVPQSNASLFSDIDSDEDDLFGGGARKITKVSTVKTSATTQSVPTTTQTSKSKTMADNPLADLL